MNVKRLSGICCLMLMLAIRSVAQPTYKFNVSAASATESGASVVAGYVKADVAPATADSVQVIYRSGNIMASHMDIVTRTVIYFAAGVDSMPFQIQLHDDTFTQHSELAVYAIRNNGTSAVIDADSMLYFTLLDNDILPTISWVADTASAYIDDDTAYVCGTVYNPNPFYTRFYTRTYDCWFHTPLMTLDGCGAVNYYYDWDTIYAPPGYSTFCRPVKINNDTAVLPDKHILIMLQEVDAAYIPDSVLLFTIRNANAYQPPSVSFDLSNITIVKDTAVLLGIPMTVANPNHIPFTYRVDTIQFSTTSFFRNTAADRITFQNYFFTPPVRSTSYDTLWVPIINTGLINDTSTITFAIKDVRQNLSSDTLFNLTIIDTGSLFISFRGAAFAHLKTDSIGYVQVFTSAPVKYDISARVTYLNGDAVMGVDFLWLDTTVIFPANTFDTISLPVIMLRNGIHDGNKQVNLRLSNVSPANTVYDIIQYTYMIIDNDSLAVWPTGILDADGADAMKVYPNPFGAVINIHSEMSGYQATITNILGEKVQETGSLSGDAQISMIDMPAGSYVLRVSDGTKIYTKLITKM